MRLSIPIKPEGKPFMNYKDAGYVPRRLFGRLCWLKFVVSAVLHGDLFSPRGIAYEWKDQVWTCYMRISPPWKNVYRRFLVDHEHDSFCDPYVDPENGKRHHHRLDGSPDPWTKESHTAESSNCWCQKKAA